MVTVTDGWCPTAARIIGVGMARPDCCCGPRDPTVLRLCYSSIGRYGAIRAAPGLCRVVLETVTRLRRRRRSAKPTRRPDCLPSICACGRRWSRPRWPGSAELNGPTRRSSPMPAATSRLRRQLAAATDRPGARSAGPWRRTAAAPAAHHGDRGRGLRLVHARRRGSDAVTSESSDQLAAASADVSCSAAARGSLAAVMARTTTIRRAPASRTSGSRSG